MLAVCTVGYSTAKEKSVTEVAQKEIKANVDKDSRKVAKQMAKEGWQTMPGRVTLEKQIERSKVAELSVNEDGENVYVIATHKALGGNYSAAKNIASTRAKGELASQLKSHIKRTIVDKNSNKYISPDEMQLLDENISASLESIDLDIAGVTNLLEIYRDADGGKCEVMMTMSIKADLIVSQALDKISRELAQRTDLLIK